MATSDIEKVLTVLQGAGSGDSDLAVRHINPKKYMEHNPRSGDGVEGLRKYISQLSEVNHHLKVVRVFHNDPYVFTQTDGLALDQNTFFDIFRFEDGLIVEQWVFSAKAAPPNKSGHTQTDGPAQAKHISDGEKNKSFMRKYYSWVDCSRYWKDMHYSQSTLFASLTAIVEEAGPDGPRGGEL